MGRYKKEAPQQSNKERLKQLMENHPLIKLIKSKSIELNQDSNESQNS
jgi:hypothetical protein